MKGILADNDVIGQVAQLVEMMQEPEWAELWVHVGLAVLHFEDVGLPVQAADSEIWRRCQESSLILITGNRNADAPDSLTDTIRRFNTPESLRIFTIANVSRFGKSREYRERIVARLYDYLFRIDELRGTGRLFLP